MKPRTSLLSQLWRKLFPAEPKPPIRLASPEQKPRPARERSFDRGIEPLEGRIAPATLLPGGKTLTYTDVDGDLVTIQFSKAIPTGVLTDLTDVFKFDHGKVHTGAGATGDDVPQLLQLIDFTAVQTVGITSGAEGISMTMSVKKVASSANDTLHGDGFANVGAIKASNITLGAITVAGDLGQIDAGSNFSPVGVQALKVKTLGKLTNTQTGTADYESKIIGALGSFTAEAVEGAYLHVVNGFNFGSNPSLGKINTLTVSGYVKARATGIAAENDGLIQTDSSIGAIVIGSNGVNAQADFSDGLNGGAGGKSGSIIAGGRIGSLVVKGALRGNVGANSGSVSAVGDIGSVLVTKGLLGGVGQDSASIHSDLQLGTVTIGTLGGPGLLGGAGDGSGVIDSDGTIGVMTLSAVEGVGPNSGGVTAQGTIARVNILGALKGAAQLHSGFVESYYSIGDVTIGGGVLGGGGDFSGSVVSASTLGNVTVTGSLQGGVGLGSGGIFSGTAGYGGMGAVRISQGLLGGAGGNSGMVSSGGNIASLTIAKTGPTGTVPDALLGGGGTASGSVYAFGAIGPIGITGSVHGGGGDFSGSIQGHGSLPSIVVKGSVLGGNGASSGTISSYDFRATAREVAGSFGSVSLSGSIAGGQGAGSGAINADGAIFSLTAGGFLKGAGAASGAITAGLGQFAVGNIGKLNLGQIGNATTGGGAVLAYGAIGDVTASQMFGGSIRAEASLNSLTVNGNVSDATVSAIGQAVFNGKTDLAISKIVVLGNVSGTDFLAGYSTNGSAANGHAQIGTVQVNGSWSASNLIAGVKSASVTNGRTNFGGSSDAAITVTDGSSVISRIASVVIGGAVSGSSGTADHFGFSAHEIGAFQSGGVKLGLTAATGQTFELTSTTSNDVTVREVV